MAHWVVYLIVVFFSHIMMAGDLYVDQFYTLQSDLIVKYEQPVDIQQSLTFGINSVKDTISEVDYTFFLYDLSYRRYIENTTTGVFYSFGFRAGKTRVSDGVDSENEILTMPYYDIGIKSKLSTKWSHILKLEAGYVMLFTDNVDVDPILGLHFVPYFSFGYNLD